MQQIGHSVRRGTQVQQATDLGSLLDPGIVIAVAVENDTFVLLDGLPDQTMQCCVKVLGLLQLVRVLTQRLRHGGVEHDVAAGNGVGGAQHTELELIAGERKGRCPVPVGSITQELGQHMGSQLHHGLFRAAVRLIFLDGIQNSRQLIAQKDGYHRGRRLVGAQTVIIAGGGHRDAQQVLIVIHRLNNSTQEQQELGVFVGCLTGSQ